MNITFDLRAGPPSPDVIEPVRKRQEKLLPILLIVLIACPILGSVAYFQFWNKYPDWQFTLELGLIGLGILAPILLWKLCTTIFSLTRLNEAHPVTANAYLESTSNEVIRSYCRKVIQQGRNLTLREADIILGHYKTREEILRLAAYYEEHAPLAIIGGSISIGPPG